MNGQKITNLMNELKINVYEWKNEYTKERVR